MTAKIERATDPTASAWVSANAGAGKTQLLANRVTRLLLAGNRPERILCLTYTKAAAAEMSRRLFKDLGGWALLPDDQLAEQLAKVDGGPVGAEELKRARTLFAQALETPGGLKIQTIHSFCQLLLSRFPIEAGVPPRFQVLDERSADELMRSARNAVLLRADGDRNIRDALAVIASRASDVRFGELLDLGINAGRGRIADLVKDHDGDEKRFFAHMRAKLGAPDVDEETLLTRFCESLGGERETCKRAAAWLSAGSTNDQKLGAHLHRFIACIAHDDAIKCLQKIFFKTDGSPRANLVTGATGKRDSQLNAWLEELRVRFVAFDNQLRAVRIAAVTEAIVTVALAVTGEYARLKRLRAALDYDDLILHARDLLLKADASAWVLYKLDGGIDHILVDEAQDTSHDQWEIVRQLAGEFFAGKGAHEGRVRTLFAVGDEKQSIFSFQGAAPKEFGVNRTHFRGLAERAQLDFEDAHPAISRRSARKILEFVDAVFAQDAARAGLTYDKETVRHEGDRDEVGRVEVWPTIPVPEDADPDPWAPVDAAPKRGSHVQLAQQIARRIKELITSGAQIPDKHKPGKTSAATAGDIMILVRRRNAFATEMIRQLLDVKIPVAGADRMVLTEQMAIQDLVALGRFALLPEDDLNLAALLKAPFLNLTEDDLFDLAHDRKQGLWKVLTARKDERPQFAHAHEFLSAALAAADMTPPFEFYARILGRGVRRQIVARLGDEAADAVDEFLALALMHEGAHAPSLESFLDWFEKGASDVKRDMEHAGGAVRVMTIHGAKGLEAPIVVVPDTTQVPVNEQRAPLLYTKDCVFFAVRKELEVPAVATAKDDAHDREMEEYRRLLYVALTRARDWLIVAGYEMKQPDVHPQSWYPMLKAAAEAMGATGDADTGALVLGNAVVTGAAATTAKAEVKPPPEFLRTPAPKEPPAWRILRPFDAAGEEEPALLSPLANNGARFRRGILVHALLAALPNAPPHTRAQAAENYLAREGVAPTEAVEIAQEALAIFAHPDFAPLFADGSRAEVPIVADLPELGAGIRVSGQIDRLAVTADSVLVADFKTNRPPPKTAEQTPTLYRAQMALYRAALKKIYPAKRIDCALIWTDGARLMPLPAAMLDAEIVKITQRLVDNPAA